MKDNKKIIIITIISILLVTVLVVGATYAFFTGRSESNVQKIQAGELSLVFDDSTAMVRAGNIVPIAR